jgi:5'(3')-deoxyribonucleotidase
MRRFCARPSGLIAASQDMSATAIRQWVRETAQRLEDELAEEQDIFILAASETGKPSSIQQKTDRLDARAPLVNLESYLRGNRNAMLKFQPQN